MLITIINGQAHRTDPSLAGFELKQKSSSNIEFYGSNENQIFVQFKNGGAYIYKNIEEKTIQDLHQAESIGKFVAALSKVHGHIKLGNKLVEPETQPDGVVD
jgi:hypothetical protein